MVLFTGIIEEVGRVVKIQRGASSAELCIRAKEVLDETKVGDSIAVNGVCLTVTALQKDSFTADVMPKTLENSSLGELFPDSPVNLERALRLGDRLGGHIVSGHIDGVGRILRIATNDNAHLVKIEASQEILQYMVIRGSVAVDGISLTIAELEADSFTVSIIPHTFSQTSLASKNVGSAVNLECDIIGKYVERATLSYGAANSSSAARSEDGKISLEMLIENGF